MTEPSISLSPCGYNMSNLDLSRSTKNSNLGNRIEQIGQLAPILESEPNPSNFIPQLSITQSGNSGLTSMDKQLLRP
ncbi:hypothetical protein H5410_022394 [Solanum commersonii]|uniref:Uncharacterized protein n=1 Tax=Solanum commersonii TaxID=4109 RepID=A0A9J5ZE15_SOLCO|nr:hypothetical protein H5410_022394 [Solanum commersonii]